MEVRGNGMRFYNYDKWEHSKYESYNYKKQGLLNRVMSPAIVNTNNPFLRVILQYVESSLVFVMQYVDILKNFKNVRWKNR
jgi:hypothetical protein